MDRSSILRASTSLASAFDLFKRAFLCGIRASLGAEGNHYGTLQRATVDYEGATLQRTISAYAGKRISRTGECVTACDASCSLL